MREDKEFADSKNAEFLNANSILDVDSLSWDVSIYKIIPLIGNQSTNENRGNIKIIMWELHRQHKRQRVGYGFSIDVGKTPGPYTRAGLFLNVKTSRDTGLYVTASSKSSGSPAP